MPYDGGRVETQHTFSEMQVKEALIAHFGLPDDAQVVVGVTEDFGRMGDKTGYTVKFRATYKQVLKTKGKNAPR